MSTRALLGRLNKLGPIAGPDAPVCRWHGTACQLGRRWPLSYEPGVDDELAEAIAKAKRCIGEDPGPSRRERWAHQDHELVPPAELAERAKDTATRLAEAKARVAAEEAALIAGEIT